MNSNRFLTISRISLGLFVFTLPLQIRIVLKEPSFYANGNFNPYITSFLYVNDLVLLFALTFFGLSLIKNYEKKIHFGPKPLNIFLLLFVILFEIQTIILGNFENFPVSALRLIEWYGLYILIINGVLPLNEFLRIFIVSALIQSVVAGLQFFLQHSVHLNFFGEANMGPEMDGIAKIHVGERNIVRSYGTLPHPNVLGGFLSFAIFFTLYAWKERFRRIILILLATGLVLTFSRSAFIAISVSTILFLIFLKPMIHLKKYIMKLMFFGAITVGLLSLIGLPTLSALTQRFKLEMTQPEVYERLNIAETGVKIIEHEPFIGIGAGNFTNSVQKYSDDKLLPWEYQPAHNIPILIGSELGVFGTFLLIATYAYCFRKIFQENKTFVRKDHKAFTFLLFFSFSTASIIMLFDHYFITLYQGQILLIIILSQLALAISMSEKKRIKKLTET